MLSGKAGRTRRSEHTRRVLIVTVLRNAFAFRNGCVVFRSVGNLPPKQIIHIGREDLIRILEACKDKLVGMGIYEYVCFGKKLPLIEELIQYGLSL